jgi:hypothetical protein
MHGYACRYTQSTPGQTIPAHFSSPLYINFNLQKPAVLAFPPGFIHPGNHLSGFSGISNRSFTERLAGMEADSRPVPPPLITRHSFCCTFRFELGRYLSRILGIKRDREIAFAEITAFLTANNAENKLFFAANNPIITAGGAEIVYP